MRRREILDRMTGMRIVGALAALSLASCVGASSVNCLDGRTCPSGTSCDDDHHLCLGADQRSACDGHADGATCTFEAGRVAGLCDGGVCIAQTCGDGIVTPPEQCDPKDPTPIDCMAIGFYRPGTAACTLDCRYDHDACSDQGFCGDGTIDSGHEFCEPDQIPGGANCPSFGFDNGSLVCSGLCAPDFAGCEAYGWVATDSKTLANLDAV